MTLITKLKPLLSKVIFLPLLLTITSCGDDPNLPKVRQFSLLSEQAEKQLPVITNDLYLSCLRTARYEAISLLPPEPDQSPATARLQLRVDEQKACNNPRPPSPPPRQLSSLMNQGNGIIVLYMKKLGQLASDDLLNFDTEFGKLKASSKNLAGGLTTLFGANSEKSEVVQTQVDAGVNLFQIITEEIFKGKRMDTLNNVISGANQPLADYADGLETVVQKVYIDQYLSNEETSLNQYYISYIGDLADTKHRPTPFVDVKTVLTLEDRWNLEKDKIQERRQLAEDYIDLLQQIVASHQRLAIIYNNGQEISQLEVKSEIQKTTKALEKFVKTAQKVSALNQK